MKTKQKPKQNKKSKPKKIPTITSYRFLFFSSVL